MFGGCQGGWRRGASQLSGLVALFWLVACGEPAKSATTGATPDSTSTSMGPTTGGTDGTGTSGTTAASSGAASTTASGNSGGPAASTTTATSSANGAGDVGGASTSGDSGGTGGSSDSGGSAGSAGSGGSAGAGASGSGGADNTSDTSDTTSDGSTTSGGGGDGSDVFGIDELYPSAPGGGLWTSEHWAGGDAYDLTDRIDEHDPLGISGMRGEGNLEVTGDGELLMGGSQPRIYIYPSDAGPWRDVEVTVYYQRVNDAATAWAGLVVGARSGPEGHGDDPCDAHTYYSRLRHDGATDFEKELMHSPSSTQSSIDAEEVWPPDGELPFDTWIGWKFVIYNLPDGESIKLESYRDMSGGEGGGDWQLLNETIDDGGWFTETDCEEHSPENGESDLVVLDGGTTFIRNTDVSEARYKWVSVREIAPNQSP